MRPDDAALIGHMLDMARTAQTLVAGVSRAELDQDVKLQLALVRALQIIGEAAWRVSDTSSASHGPSNWPQPSTSRIV